MKALAMAGRQSVLRRPRCPPPTRCASWAVIWRWRGRKRGISTSDMAARLFVGRNTLWRLERGDPTVALGTLVTAAFVLNLHDRLANLAAPASDDLALSLDERRLPQRIRRKSA